MGRKSKSFSESNNLGFPDRIVFKRSPELSMRTLSLVFFLCLCPLAFGQRTLSYGDDQTLPTFTPKGADHATLAVNSYGDVFVAWQGTFGGNRHVIEGMVIKYVGNDQWESGAANHLLLGDMSLHLLGPDETCPKPDVVEMPDGSFCIAWQRIDRTGIVPARLEVARVQVRDAQGQLLPNLIIDQQAAGTGYVVDPSITSGFAGIMVDLVNLEDGSVAAVYAHETMSTVNAQGDEYREYDLRCTRIDWNQLPTSQGFASTPVVLTSGIAIDTVLAHPLNGGQVLPDVVLDDNSNLVVAYEQFWLDGHGGVNGTSRGEIFVRRYAGFNAANPLIELDAVSLTNNPRRHQRRPNVATSRADHRNSVSVTWVDDEVSPLKTNTIHSREVVFDNPGGPTVETLFWGNNILREDTHAAIAHGPQRQRYTFGVRFFPSAAQILVGRTTQTDMTTFPVAVRYAKRPAVSLVEFPAASGRYKLFASYEGDNLNNPEAYQVHFVVVRVP